MIRRKRTSERTERHHVILYHGDLERLKMYYPENSPSTVIRELVRALCDKNERLIAAKNPIKVEIPDDELQRILSSLGSETKEP